MDSNKVTTMFLECTLSCFVTLLLVVASSSPENDVDPHHHEHQDGVGFSGTSFIHVRQMPVGRQKNGSVPWHLQETRVLFGGRLVLELSRGEDSGSWLFHRRVTDGERLMELVYRDGGELMSCELERRPEVIAKFVENFLGYAEGERVIGPMSLMHKHEKMFMLIKLDDILRRLRARGNLFTTVETIRNFASANDLPFDDQGSLVDFQTMEDECYQIRRDARRLAAARRTQPSKDGKVSGPFEVTGSVAKKGSVSRQRRSKLILRDTKWCGKGNMSSHDEDLGNDVRTDRCCQQHDNCPHTIEGFTFKYNLFNYRFHTLSWCECDNDFRNCLGSGGPQADLVGSLYFNVIGMKCFALTPKQVCVERYWWGGCKTHGREFSAEIKDPLPWI